MKWSKQEQKKNNDILILEPNGTDCLDVRVRSNHRKSQRRRDQ